MDFLNILKGRNVLKLVYLILILNIFSINLLADTVFVYPTKATRVEDGLGDAVKDLIETSVGEHGHQVVESKTQAKYRVKSKITRLGGTYTVMLKLYEGKKPKFSSKLKSKGEDELDTVVGRLVSSAFGGKKSAKASKKVGEITESEVTEVSRRTESKNYTYLALGPYALSNLGVSGAGYYFGYGKLWEVTPNAAIKFMAEWALRSKGETATFGTISGGANYFFTPDSTSFFVGADFGYGGAATTAPNLKSSSGFSIGLQAGVVFFRTASTQMSLTGRYVTIFEDNESGTPSMAGLSLGFHF